MTEVRFENVAVAYGTQRALCCVSFVADAGALTALVGPSGVGKTTLLHAVNRLHELDGAVRVSGRLTVGGDDVTTLSPYVLRRRVGLIFQRPTPFPLSVVENLRFPLRAHGVPKSELADRAEAALRRAALWDEVRDRLDAPATTLSGGQQQRLCIARALALEPEVLLLDEPCASLDPVSTALIEDTLRALIGSTTLLMVTHNVAQAHRLASRTACLWPTPEGGRLLDVGPTERVFADPADDRLRGYFSGAVG